MIIVYISHLSESNPALLRRKEHTAGMELLLYGLNNDHNINIKGKELEDILTSVENGKPVLPQGYPCFNISHSSGYAVCAMSRHRLGADIESVRPFRERILRKTLSDRESIYFSDHADKHEETKDELFFRFWTLKESAIKYSGAGLREPLSSHEFCPVCTGRAKEYPFEAAFDKVKALETDLHYYQTMIRLPGLSDCLIISICSEHKADDIRLVIC